MKLSTTRRSLPLLIGGIGLCLSTLLFAQEYRATITGKVTDPSGSPIPNADVTVTGIGTNFVTTSKTDPSGNYSVPFLSPGGYTVKISASGFITGVRDNIQAHAGDKVQVDMGLQLGQTTQSVTVSALERHSRRPCGTAVATNRGANLQWVRSVA